MTNQDKAIALHNKGYNCCQAVACAFANQLGEDEAMLFRIAEGFGLGMGCMDGVCGALSGAVMVAGLDKSGGDLNNPTTKGATYQVSREMLQAFREKTGSIICKELKGAETGKMLCSCQDCIRAGVAVVEEVISNSD